MVSRTQTCPGVWPREGSRRRNSSTAWSSDTNTAWPASTTGTTLSAMQPYSSRPDSISYFQNCHSSPGITYRARGKVGTHVPSAQRVFQPTWSTWRCVHTTTSTWSGVTPAAARSSRKALWRMFHTGFAVRVLPLPTPVSMSTVWRGVLTTNVWMREPRSPVLSSQKCGRSQWWCRAMASALESGSIWAVGYVERPISTTRVMLTGPRRIVGMRGTASPVLCYRDVRCVQSESAPRSATSRPRCSAQCASPPNSARHDQSRRVTKCSECS